MTGRVNSAPRIPGFRFCSPGYWVLVSDLLEHSKRFHARWQGRVGDLLNICTTPVNDSTPVSDFSDVCIFSLLVLDLGVPTAYDWTMGRVEWFCLEIMHGVCEHL